jgi:ABC-type polysaccharide/polyol phosphate export permease
LVSLPLVNLWNKKTLIFQFSLIGVKLRYKGTYLGFLWNALEPLLTFLLLYVVFTALRDRPDNFAMYLLSGILIFHVFTRGSMAGLGSLRSNKNFLTTLGYKNEFYPVVTIGSITLTTIVEMGVLLALMPVFNFVPSWTLVLFPITVLMMLVLIMGLTYLFSIVSLYFKDIQPLWAVIAHALFFISPIFWYLEEADGILLTLFYLNPVGQIIELTHHVVVFGTIPPLMDWLYTSAFVLGIFALGFAVFNKYEKRAVEEL